MKYHPSDITTRSMTNTNSGDDDFWAIAMEDNSNKRGAWSNDDSDDDEIVDSTKVMSYRIPSNDDDDAVAPTILRLQPLPATDGVWSPVGADAWYSSALLASLLLWCDKDSRLSDVVSSTSASLTTHRHHHHPLASILHSPISVASDNISGSCTTTILELGSGAVGLSGLVCALALERQSAILQQRQATSTVTPKFKVLLTDNDPACLEQLQFNVEENRAKLAASTTNKSLVQVQVAAWDWKDEYPASGLAKNDNVTLVIGSELVYTSDTANACVGLLVRLLDRYPQLTIWIVQVSDRYGWWEIVVPTLQEHQNISVESVPISSEIHDMAATMIPMGGTLDRHAYGAFCIYNNNRVDES